MSSIGVSRDAVLLLADELTPTAVGELKPTVAGGLKLAVVGRLKPTVETGCR